jgi:hypothetical protein
VREQSPRRLLWRCLFILALLAPGTIPATAQAAPPTLILEPASGMYGPDCAGRVVALGDGFPAGTGLALYALRSPGLPLTPENVRTLVATVVTQQSGRFVNQYVGLDALLCTAPGGDPAAYPYGTVIEIVAARTDGSEPSPRAGSELARASFTVDRGSPLPREQRCFAETLLCVQGRFHDYWLSNGGLERNGFPLTPERREVLEDGNEYTVQYFERVRMEYHPENAAPNDVLLGQFGRRIFVYRGGQLAPAAPLPGQVYFPETGHNLGGRFLDYWRANGGLAQFGYPISEEQIDWFIGGPSTNYRVQYFERARLEYHPENEGTPYTVLLAQFGREILAEVDLVTGDIGRLYLTNERVRTRLGRPRAVASPVSAATLAFEHGSMLWRGDRRQIFALDGTGERGTLLTDEYARTIFFDDRWQEGDDPGGGPAPTPGTHYPGRGFGKIWRDGSGNLAGRPPLPYVRERLGYALTPEEVGYTATLQEFERGLILSSPDGRSLTVIVNTSAKCCIGGDYERFPIAAR